MISPNYTAWCDNCPAWTDGASRTKYECGESARAEGWLVNQGRVLCPDCRKSVP